VPLPLLELSFILHRVYYYYTWIYNGCKFRSDTESDALVVTRWPQW